MSGGNKPRRIQRKRTKGWRMPEGAVYVGRPTKWGNPYPMPSFEPHHMAVDRYRYWLRGTLRNGILPPQSIEITQLRGKDLACWCPLDQPCHADVVLELANRPDDQALPPEARPPHRTEIP